ncbi:UDP-glucose/GDP-mannose dehydrogenase family protein [Gammaproteobacteria bacterium]|nr:UDP-glucose/GDP-mannose dehydrogenase family protein [Gammaproteobacteria bacterium]
MNISVIGCGYVGLVTGACFAEIGHNVICLDNNRKKINLISKGILPFYESGLKELIVKNKKNTRISFTSSFKKLSQSEIIFICVDTPFGKSGNPNLKNFNQVRDSLLKSIKRDVLIVTKSTVPIGTNQKLARFYERKMASKSYEIKVCSNPEFLKEGSAVKDFLNPDRIIVGSSDNSVIELMRKAYSPLRKEFNNFIPMSCESAELTKYASNSFLATKISFINEISRIADSAGANMHEVKLGMGHDPRIGNQFLESGLGYGGSCFPKDLAAICSYQKKKNIKGGIVRSVIQVNNDQVLYFFNKINKIYKKTLGCQEIALWGLSFKPNTDDLRESVGIRLVKILAPQVKHLHIFDPACKKEDVISELGSLKNYTIMKDQYAFSENTKCLVICTEWDEFKNLDYSSLDQFKIFDGRNILDRPEVEKNQLEYFAIGT